MPYAFFDLDDTLVDAKAALRAWSADFAAAYIPAGKDAAQDVYEHVTAAENWREFVRLARTRYGMTASDDHLMDHVATVFPGKFVLEDHVRDGLAGLRAAGWRLGVVTNGTTRVQQAKVDSVGLRPHLDVVVDSEAAGYRKPDRGIFEVAAGRLGVELGPHGWMIGDRLDKDVAGGAAAGLRTIWITQDAPPEQSVQRIPEHQRPADAPHPTHIVASITEAFAIVRTGDPACAPA